MQLMQNYDRDVKETVVVGAFVVVISIIIVSALIIFSVYRDSKHDETQTPIKNEQKHSKDRRSQSQT